MSFMGIPSYLQTSCIGCHNLHPEQILQIEFSDAKSNWTSKLKYLRIHSGGSNPINPARCGLCTRSSILSMHFCLFPMVLDNTHIELLWNRPAIFSSIARCNSDGLLCRSHTCRTREAAAWLVMDPNKQDIRHPARSNALGPQHRVSWLVVYHQGRLFADTDDPCAAGKIVRVRTGKDRSRTQ